MEKNVNFEILPKYDFIRLDRMQVFIWDNDEYGYSPIRFYSFANISQVQFNDAQD